MQDTRYTTLALCGLRAEQCVDLLLELGLLRLVRAWEGT